MTVYGVQVEFRCADGEQYEAIGAFWDAMRLCCTDIPLLGVGFAWRNDTLQYLIGTESGVPENTAEKIAAQFPGAVSAELRLPDSGWKTYTATADTLDELYGEIYRDGPLDYEIEEIKADGSAVIRIWRKEG